MYITHARNTKVLAIVGRVARPVAAFLADVVLVPAALAVAPAAVLGRVTLRKW
jgi:hypothetical protein